MKTQSLAMPLPHAPVASTGDPMQHPGQTTPRAESHGTASPGQDVATGNRLHRLLLAELSQAGCFRRATGRVLAHGSFILTVYAVCYVVLLTQPHAAIRALAILALAFVSVQAGALAHAAGHGAVTRSRRATVLVGQVFNTLLTGLSYTYFQHIHRLHHDHCNDRARDPDMQSSIVSLYAQSALTKSGLGKRISRHQPFLLWALIGLQGFTLKIDGLMFLRHEWSRTRLDQLFLLLHVAMWLIVPTLWLGLGDALLNYGLMTLLIGYHVGSLFLVNHIGTRVIEPGESGSFLMQKSDVTRNLGDSWLADFVCIELNNHIEHHLFPSMPPARLRTARRVTRDFFRRHGLPYHEMSWLSAAREVTEHLRAMSRLVPR